MKPILAIYGIQDRYSHKFPGYTHDHNLSLLANGKIEKYLHLERYTRRKNDNRLPEFIEEILDNHLNLEKEFEFVSVNSFVGNSFISKTGRLRIEPNEPIIVNNKSQGAKGWFQKDPWKGFEPTCHIISHELAHIFSCLPFFGDFKENSLLIHFDGGASLGNFSAFHFVNNQLSLIESHWELSHLSKFYNDNALSFALMKAKPGEHCSVPGKLMGYAAMGNTSLEIENWLESNSYFKDIWDDHSSFNKAAKYFDWNGKIEDNEDQFLMDVAAGLQSIFQTGIISKIKELKEKTNANYLYYSGGCALNISTNSQIVNNQLFKNVFIPPACNDSGLSLGAASFVNWKNGEKTKTIAPFLNLGSYDYKIVYTDIDIKLIADKIMEGEIIGICNGKPEIGPRALGNRSIIARADKKSLAEKVSIHCKGREWFRPVAPIMLERNTRKVTGNSDIHHLSKYMLLDFKVEKQFSKQLEGVIHKNGTSRIQTIFSRAENPFIFDLLNYLEKTYGILALINTSFNKRGEPIVNTIQEAIESAKSMNLDAVVINGKYQSI